MKTQQFLELLFVLLFSFLIPQYSHAIDDFIYHNTNERLSCPDDPVDTYATIDIEACGSYTVPSGGATYLSSGTVTDVIPNACGADSIITINVIINPLPVVDAGADVTLCEEESVTLTASGALTYLWADGTAGATNTVVPSESGSYTVIGFDENGCFATDVVAVIIEEDPIVDAGPDITICLGESVTLSGAGAGLGGDYIWEPGGIPDGGVVSPTETTTYTVTGETVNGCTNTDMLTIFVNDLPEFDAGPDIDVCEGDGVILGFPIAPDLDYDWSDDVIAGEVFFPTESGEYILTGTDVEPCTNTDTILVTVNPLPIIDAGPDESICLGESFTLLATGADPTYIYNWTDGIPNGTVITPVSPGVYTYTVSVTDANGCTSEDEITITVHPLPLIDAGDDLEICDGELATLSGSGGLLGSYVWDPAIGDGIAFAPPLGTTTYTVTGTDANGCSNTDEVSVTVNPLPTIFAGVDETVCEGTLITFEGTGTGLGGTYTWDPAEVIDGETFAVIATTTFEVTGTDINGCSNTDEVTINIYPAPPVDAGPDQAICLGEGVILAALDTDPAVIYEWSDGFSDGDFVSPVVTTTYTLTATNGLGCTSEDEITITVNLLPLIDAGSDVAVCTGELVTLSGSGGLPGTYVWDLAVEDGIAFGPPLGTTTYTVTGTDANGCSNSDEVEVTVFDLPTIDAGIDVAVCTGELVTLSGSGGLPGTYVWDPAAEDGIAFGPPLGTTTYTVTGTDANGCSNSDEVDIIVNDAPLVEAGPDTTICSFESITLEGAGAGPDGEYAWTGGIFDGVEFIPAGTFTYTLTASDINGCIGTDDVTVIVNPSPLIDAGSDTTICSGTELALTAATGGIGVEVTWSGGIEDGELFEPLATATYTATATDDFGCTSFDEVTVFVVEGIEIDAGPDVSICDGEITFITATGAGLGGTYSWTGGIINGFPFYPDETNSYIVTGTSIDGCTGSDILTITVNPLSSISAGADREICEGEEVELSAFGAGTEGVYEWSGGIDDGDAITPSMTTELYVIGTDINGCASQDTVLIIVHNNPEADLTADNLIGCAPNSVNFEVISGGGMLTYEWSFGDGEYGVGSSVNHLYSSPGLYDINLTVTNEYGCTSSVSIDDYIAIGEKPIALFEHNGDEADAVLSLVDFENFSINADSYFWEFDNLGTSEEENPSFSFGGGEDLNYEVKLIAYNEFGCADTAYSFFQIDEKLVYYIPNAFTPTINDFNLTFKPQFSSGLDIMNYHLTIFNRWGEIIFESHNEEVGWDGRYGDRDFVEQGVYIWRIEYGVTYTDEMFSDEGHVTVLR